MMEIIKYLEEMTRMGKTIVIPNEGLRNDFGIFNNNNNDDGPDFGFCTSIHCPRMDVCYLAADEQNIKPQHAEFTGFKNDVFVTIHYFPGLDANEYKIIIWDGDQCYLIKNGSSSRYVRDILKEAEFKKVTLER